MKVRYSPQAINDLDLIKYYIETVFGSASGATKIIAKIVKSCNMLKEQPQLGMKLENIIDSETDVMYIISGKFLVFYKNQDEFISIIRIIDSRTNYIKEIFDL